MSTAAPQFQLARDSLQAHEPSAGIGRIRRRGYQRFLHLMSFVDLAFVWRRRWFFITMILGFALMSAPTPAGLTHEGQIVLVMSLMATMLFITEAIPLPTVPLLIIVGEVVLLGVDSDRSRPQPDDRFRALHHGLADACRGHRQAAARQAHRLVDRADDRHERLLDQLRHHRGLRRSRRLHRRAHGCRHDAAGGRHADHAHLERPEEGPQSGGGHPVLDFLWLLHRGCGDAVRRRPQRHHHQLLEGLLLQSARSGNAPLPDGLRHLDHLRLPDVPAPPAHRGGTADLHVQAGSHGHVAGHQPAADAGLDAGSHARQ